MECDFCECRSRDLNYDFGLYSRFGGKKTTGQKALGQTSEKRIPHGWITIEKADLGKGDQSNPIIY
jgi:hypothetical protein